MALMFLYIRFKCKKWTLILQNFILLLMLLMLKYYFSKNETAGRIVFDFKIKSQLQNDSLESLLASFVSTTVQQ